jgi:fructokinase
MEIKMNLLSFGEIIWDAYRDSFSLGGAPLNLAAHSAIQGGNAWLASAVGDDAHGASALEHIKALGIKTEYVNVHRDLPTGKCIVTLEENGHPSYKILENVAYDKIVLPEHPNQKFDVVAFGTLAMRSGQNRKSLELLLHNNSFEEIYTDLNIRPPFYSKESVEFCLSNATIVKISDEELPTVTQLLFGRDLSLDDACELIRSSYPQIKLILITQGEKGAICYDCQSNKTYNCKAAPATVRSTVGAGDSYGATFLTWYFKTKDIMLSMTLASKVSAFVVSHQEAIPDGTKEFIKSVVPT